LNKYLIKKIVYLRRAIGGPSVIVSSCFNYFKKSELAFISENIESLKY